MKGMAVMIWFTLLGGWVGAWLEGRLTSMRSQEDDGKQQRGSQPDHTPEADQASQDKLGPQSVTLGLAAQPVVVSECWCWGGRGNEVAWVGGVAGERGGKDFSCFWASRLPNVIPQRLCI